jgi:hypothetical protein
MKKTLIEILGWYGAIAILTAYALLSFRVFDASTLWYQVLNATGSLGILIEAWSKKDIQPATLNLVWVVVAVIAIFNII